MDIFLYTVSIILLSLVASHVPNSMDGQVGLGILIAINVGSFSWTIANKEQ